MLLPSDDRHQPADDDSDSQVVRALDEIEQLLGPDYLELPLGELLTLAHQLIEAENGRRI